jgi:hypothetical protein
MALAAGMSAASVHRLWAANDIKPHLSRIFELSNDKQFVLRREIAMPGSRAHATGPCRQGSAIFASRPMITSGTAR